MAVRFSREQWMRWGSSLRPETLEGKAAFSLIAHLIVLFFLFNSWWFGAKKLHLAGTDRGARVMAAYVAGKPTVAVKAKAAKPRRRLPSKVALPVVAPPKEEAAAEALANDALGNDEVSIARVEGFPRERPDLSGVGALADLIVDVDIDDTGRVTQVHARKGVGTSVDAVVVATVEQWIFHPALRRGKPVGSTRELHFRIDRRRNPDCGWDCFTLAAD